MNLFGKYTERFANLVETRVDIKEKNFDKAKARWNGKIDKYLDDINNAKKLSTELKTAINSVYGLTSAILIILAEILEMKIRLLH